MADNGNILAFDTLVGKVKDSPLYTALSKGKIAPLPDVEVQAPSAQPLYAPGQGKQRMQMAPAERQPIRIPPVDQYLKEAFNGF